MVAPLDRTPDPERMDRARGRRRLAVVHSAGSPAMAAGSEKAAARLYGDRRARRCLPFGLPRVELLRPLRNPVGNRRRARSRGALRAARRIAKLLRRPRRRRTDRPRRERRLGASHGSLQANRVAAPRGAPALPQLAPPCFAFVVTVPKSLWYSSDRWMGWATFSFDSHRVSLIQGTPP